jgi:hypothetical protein
MIEARAMARELQEQLNGAVKASQEQFRKGQETAANAVRTWTNTAKTARPRLQAVSLPKLPDVQLPKLADVKLPSLADVKLPSLADVKQAGVKLREVKLKDVRMPEVQLPKLPVERLQRIGGAEELAENAERLANKVLAAQLKFAGRTLHNAAPVIADGAAFLTKAADKVAARVTAAQREAEVVVMDAAKATAPSKTETTKATAAKATAAKSRTAKTSSAKATAAKPAAAKATSASRKAKTDKK